MTVTVPTAILAIAALLLWLRERSRHAATVETLEHEVRKYRHSAEIKTREQELTSEELNKKHEELGILYNAAGALGASTQLEDTLQIVLSMIRRLRIPYQSCLLFLKRPDGGFELGLSDTTVEDIADIVHPLLGQKKAKILVFDSDEPSVLLVPLEVRGEIVGVVYLGSSQHHTHRPEHLEKMKALAALAAPSLKTAQLFQVQTQALSAVQAKNRQIDGLQRLSAVIGTSLNMADTFTKVSENLRLMIPSAQSVIFLMLSPTGFLEAQYADSPYDRFLDVLSLTPDDGPFARANRSEGAVLVSDTKYEAGLLAKERCAILAPLRVQDQTLGFLYLGAVNPGSFDEEQRQLVTTVAYQTSVALNNAKLYERTQQMAYTDGLTGLYLHRYFQDCLSEEIRRSEKENTSLCLVMVDTDNFKTYNDTLGHPAGDALLKDIAKLLKDKVRHDDVVCRYGGDEFAIILRNVPKDEAARTCERIRESFQLRFATMAVQVTASIGVACYPVDAKSKTELTKVADEALYVSKRGGRNRVTVAKSVSI